MALVTDKDWLRAAPALSAGSHRVSFDREGRTMAEAATKECDFCKEEIRADAVRCKHCGSVVGSPGPSHGGTCPYCKEEINPDALKCKHCGSWVAGTTTPGSGGGCGCGGTQARLGAAAGSGPGRAGLPSQMQSARPGRVGSHVILGGPWDPGDPWYCEGHYECIVLFGHLICVWICDIY
jgi:double zinc ribbon protein